MSASDKKPNRLIKEKSPYLLQHAYNPVDWYAWNEEALEKAKKDDKPIFLSIGYSACHWCHVMEHESFEDPLVAQMMNEAFVCIKVDREERPDIDNVYMTVCQMMTGSGGWPLNVILTPDKKPFYAGTYIPKEDRYGRPGMFSLIPRIKEYWTNKREDILSSAEQMSEALQQTIGQSQGEEKLDESLLEHGYRSLEQRFDEGHGGFGGAPKFPMPHNLLFLLRYYKRTNDFNALRMVEKTLQAMRHGGMYDQVGFGFHRYSTDSEWLVPHFEKMLYDNALLAMAYTEAYQVTGKEEYANTAKEIFTYILRDMTSPEGGFYSAEDADSEGHEGKFYLWSEEELHSILGKEDGEFVCRVFNTEREGNFQEEATGGFLGTNILHLKQPLNAFTTYFKSSEEELVKRWETIRQKLFEVREKRIHPGKDDKILTDWNGLMIAALAKGAQAFNEPKYAEAAKRAAFFISENMSQDDMRLLHRYRDGEAGLPAHVDDYAFFIWGLLELYQADLKPAWLITMDVLNDKFIKHYWDEKNGGFYFMADDGEDLLVRQKEIYDGAVPSGNSVAMLNLLRLARIRADLGLEKKASEIAKVFSRQVKQAPPAHTLLLCAFDFAFGPSYEIVIVGNSQAKETKEMLYALQRHFIPNKVVLLKPTEESLSITGILPHTKPYASINNQPTAYVCQNFACNQPTTDVVEMLKMLKI